MQQNFALALDVSFVGPRNYLDDIQRSFVGIDVVQCESFTAANVDHDGYGKITGEFYVGVGRRWNGKKSRKARVFLADRWNCAAAANNGAATRFKRVERQSEPRLIFKKFFVVFLIFSPFQLLLPTPSIIVDTKKDAIAPELQQFCYQSPIAIVRGMASALRLDLGLFSTKSLMETASDHQVEVRTQMLQAPDKNFNVNNEKHWYCESTRSFTTVSKYAQYQAQSFQLSLKVSSCLADVL